MKRASKRMVKATSTTAKTTSRPRLEYLETDSVKANTENPRLHFPGTTLDQLAASIDEVGILVPLSVYPEKGTNKYIIIDGERRWRCATKLGMANVPAIIFPAPDSEENLLKMFNIHMVRDPWDDMPTAWALEKLIEMTGKDDETWLSEQTGLSKERIKRLTLALRLSAHHQKMVNEGRIPLNFFFELEKNVITPLSKFRPKLLQRLGRKSVLDAFVRKKLEDVTSDTVELRKMVQIIKVAAHEARSPEDPSDLDKEIEKLVKNRTRTIQETYEETVEMVVEADKLGKQCNQLLAKLDRLIQKATSREERAELLKAAKDLHSKLSSRIATLSKTPRH